MAGHHDGSTACLTDAVGDGTSNDRGREIDDWQDAGDLHGKVCKLENWGVEVGRCGFRWYLKRSRYDGEFVLILKIGGRRG